MECPRYGSGGHGQYVDLAPEHLESFFVRDAEPLFFINDDEPEIMKFDILGKESMRADQDIDRSRFGPCQNILCCRFDSNRVTASMT